MGSAGSETCEVSALLSVGDTRKDSAAPVSQGGTIATRARSRRCGCGARVLHLKRRQPPLDLLLVRRLHLEGAAARVPLGLLELPTALGAAAACLSQLRSGDRTAIEGESDGTRHTAQRRRRLVC